MEELVDQARFAHPGLADERDDLPVAGPGLRQGLLQRFQLGLPPHKGRESPGDRGLYAPPHGRDAHQLTDRHGLGQTFHGHRPQRSDLDKALDQAQRLGRQPDAARRRQLLHAGRQVGGLADRRVVHVQVVANRAHHHLSRVEPDADAASPPRACVGPPRV